MPANNLKLKQMFSVSVIQDPCNVHRSIYDANKRSTGFNADWTVDDPITDEMLKEDWYRVISDNGDGMPTSPPGIKMCGTINPIWLKGMECIRILKI